MCRWKVRINRSITGIDMATSVSSKVSEYCSEPTDAILRAFLKPTFWIVKSETKITYTVARLGFFTFTKVVNYEYEYEKMAFRGIWRLPSNWEPKK